MRAPAPAASAATFCCRGSAASSPEAGAAAPRAAPRATPLAESESAARLCSWCQLGRSRGSGGSWNSSPVGKRGSSGNSRASARRTHSQPGSAAAPLGGAALGSGAAVGLPSAACKGGWFGRLLEYSDALRGSSRISSLPAALSPRLAPRGSLPVASSPRLSPRGSLPVALSPQLSPLGALPDGGCLRRVPRRLESAP